jgi:hypothetical protein
MEHCQSNGDCRTDDGYVCADPRLAPWNAAILDNNQSQSVCIQPTPGNSLPSVTQDGAVEGGVCTKSLPDLPDAFPSAPAAPGPDASGDSSVDANVDGAAADGPTGD